ncbi:Crp/Fnr family transcriptional regulator [Chitinophaga nivalis]|uniref:Crp/Fnr family transcriptional regulator n=1 Tax=Chitinophaga nivalis TaxID=2991709 RepID=A0ABT3IQV0_9BACT|nr:Crp/Fnr family transcriptional regulator [Chitinophaga nivalis]MCW3463975.1 Crp/Fnr family transcriptional regulator [Chitinophaga nivalis]MCW3486335.1 Crp/Fnr family transcriptional regulator [Chitinophaga nivalis]
MHTLLIANILKHVSLSESEQQRIPGYFEWRKTRRRQHLLREGELCDHEYFVLKGCCRQYAINREGKENVLQFSIEGWWITDLDSVVTGRPSLFNIDVLEGGEILQISKAQLTRLFDDIPAVERYYRIISQRAFIALQRRIFFLQQPARERYEAFVASYPYFETRLPQHQIAAYLGITPESLSRIRHKITRASS